MELGLSGISEGIAKALRLIGLLSECILALTELSFRLDALSHFRRALAEPIGRASLAEIVSYCLRFCVFKPGRAAWRTQEGLTLRTGAAGNGQQRQCVAKFRHKDEPPVSRGQF